MGKGFVVNSNVHDAWEVEIDTVKACSKAPTSKTIWIHPIVKLKIDTLMEEYPSTEWLAYLIGDDKGNITDLLIPKQDVCSVSVSNIVCTDYNKYNIIGVIHSHHSMGNSFSKTDDDWINQNHEISLCISSSNGISGHMRWKTPCGSYILVDVNIKLLLDTDFEKEEFIKGVKENVNDKVYSYVYKQKNWDAGFFNFKKKEEEEEEKEKNVKDDGDDNWDSNLDGETVEIETELDVSELSFDETDDKSLLDELQMLEESDMFPDE